MNRREFLMTSTAAMATLAAAERSAATPSAGKTRLGLTDATYALRRRAEAPVGSYTPLKSAVDMLRQAAELGAGCVQTSVKRWDQSFAREVRDLRESLGVILEGQIGLPKEKADVPAFEAAARSAKEAGAHVLRAVCLSGRRYETFASAEDWRKFREQSWRSMQLAEPVVSKHGLVLAVENHKDWRTEELIEIMERLGSDAVGVCLDIGNIVSLLEDPIAVVEALAPWTRTLHFKDMGLAEYEDGFLLSEVPLGQGYLDLERIVSICRAANPGVQFNLEMITRDPLEVPVLTDQYWKTFDNLPAQDLAQTLATTRKYAARGKELPRISGLSLEEQLALEEQHNRDSFEYARMHLSL